MTSNQMSAGAGKAAKFVAANPLGPMADPFAGMDDDSKEYHKEMSKNVNERIQKGMEELKQKHSTGTNEIDDPDRAPTGAAYREANRIQAERNRADRARMTQAEREKEEENERVKALRDQLRRNKIDKENDEENGNDDDDDGNANGRGGGSDSDDEYDDLLNDDAELEAIRARRMAEIKAAQVLEAENKARGHGEYRTISQDEFLPECASSSEWVAVHFFHDEFERCKIMDHHLKLVAPLHLSCKFLRIDAQKAPFFVSKLQIRTLPALLVFRDGKAVDRLTGFDKLAIDPKEPDKWHTGKLRQWLASTGAIEYTPPTEEVREEMRRMGITPRGTVWSGAKGVGSGVYYEDD
mmetsp:Transcript_33135/g.72665  ORF Transcript_33135/g.72665 Transcript_33135/m.72665 type:complete len:352 (+) Transcript_33135:84-1139(+)